MQAWRTVGRARTFKEWNSHGTGSRVRSFPPMAMCVVLLPQVCLFDERETDRPPTHEFPIRISRTGPGPSRCWKDTVRVVKTMHSQPNLVKVACAFRASGAGPHLLDGGQHEAEKDDHDRDRNQQLDKCQAAFVDHPVAPITMPGHDPRRIASLYRGVYIDCKRGSCCG